MLQGDSSMEQLAKMNTLWGGNEPLCSPSLSFFWTFLPPTAAWSSLRAAERAVGSRVTSSPDTQHQQVWEGDSKGFLNRKFLRIFKWRETEGRKKGDLEAFSCYCFSLYSWFEERVLGSERLGMCTAVERVERGKCSPRLAEFPRGKIGEAGWSLWG